MFGVTECCTFDLELILHQLFKRGDLVVLKECRKTSLDIVRTTRTGKTVNGFYDLWNYCTYSDHCNCSGLKSVPVFVLYCMHLSLDMEQWAYLLDTVMNLGVS